MWRRSSQTRYIYWDLYLVRRYCSHPFILVIDCNVRVTLYYTFIVYPDCRCYVWKCSWHHKKHTTLGFKSHILWSVNVIFYIPTEGCSPLPENMLTFHQVTYSTISISISPTTPPILKSIRGYIIGNKLSLSKTATFKLLESPTHWSLQ